MIRLSDIFVKNKETGKKYDVKKVNPEKHEFAYDYRGSKENPNPFQKEKPKKLKEEGTPEGISFTEFAQKRLEGATKIANDAKAKGGAAILTYHHFIVKLPHYKNAVDGKFNQQEAQIEMKKYLDELCSVSAEMEQIHFQELVGLIEVLGELIIKSK